MKNWALALAIDLAGLVGANATERSHRASFEAGLWCVFAFTYM
jgi:hypothetical protein